MHIDSYIDIIGIVSKLIQNLLITDDCGVRNTLVEQLSKLLVIINSLSRISKENINDT